MESSLHRRLKEQYGLEVGGRTEVAVEGFRIDAVRPDGRLIEIQSGPLGALREKLRTLLPSRQVAVVKPVIVGRRIIKRLEAGGIDLGSRRSPKRGELIDVFDDLVGVAPMLTHPNLRIELLAVEVDEIRVDRQRKPGYLVVDRVLREVLRSVSLESADDLWSLLPADLAGPFTTKELAERLGRSLPFARRVAYCLRMSGSASVIARLGNQRVYERRALNGTERSSLSGSGGPRGRSLPEVSDRGR